MSQVQLKGSYVALVTPMTGSGDVDFDALSNIVDYHLNNGTNGIVALGTTGEAVTLKSKEKEDIVKAIIKQVAGQTPVIVGTGDNCTRQTIVQTEQAKNWGADAALVVTPYYNKPSQKGLVEHYKAIAESVDLPIVLYNVPGRTACDMQPETVSELASINNIIAIKEAVDTKERMQALVKLCPKDFSILSGDDASFIDLLEAGGHGTVSVTANLVPAKIAEIVQLAISSDFGLAREVNSKLKGLHQALFVCSNPVPVKWAMMRLGLISSGYCRLPLLELQSEYHQAIVTALNDAGLEELLKAV